MYHYKDIFLGYLKFDLGQITLLCEIFKENIDLLSLIDSELLSIFIVLIENEGRQHHFLHFFEVIQRCKSEMMFEN